LDHALMLHRIEAVVHFAAFALVGESVTNPARYYQNNLVNTLNLLYALRRRKIGCIVFSSTCATYGVPEVVPITDDEKQKPIIPMATPSWPSNTPWRCWRRRPRRCSANLVGDRSIRTCVPW